MGMLQQPDPAIVHTQAKAAQENISNSKKQASCLFCSLQCSNLHIKTSVLVQQQPFFTYLMFVCTTFSFILKENHERIPK